MVEIQADEYGGGDPERIHAKLFANAMDELGLDSSYGAYLDHLPGVTLATVNLMSMFGLHRRWRGAIVGHLALFEMESSVPNRRYANGLRRLGCGERVTEFFDEHVRGRRDPRAASPRSTSRAASLASSPSSPPTSCGARRALIELDARFAEYVLAAWERGESSLRIALSQQMAA